MLGIPTRTEQQVFPKIELIQGKAEGFGACPPLSLLHQHVTIFRSKAVNPSFTLLDSKGFLWPLFGTPNCIKVFQSFFQRNELQHF